MQSKFIELLKEEEKALLILLENLEDQHQRLLANDIKAIESIVLEIKKANMEIARLEIARKKLINNVKISILINEDESGELDFQYRKVMKIVHNIKVQKDTNEAIIKQKLSYNNRIIRLLTPKDSLNTYNSLGKFAYERR